MKAAIFGLLLIAAQVAENPPPPDPLPGRLQVHAGRGGPRVILRAMPEPGLAVLRLSIPIMERPGQEGAAVLLQQMALSRHRSEAREIGAMLEADRTPSHAILTVIGPAAVYEELADLLRRLVTTPPGGAQDLAAARAMVAPQARRDMETPEPVLRRRLRDALFLLDRSTTADAGVIDAWTAELLRSFWAQQFRPEGMTVVVVGSATGSEAVAPFRDWPAPPRVRGNAGPPVDDRGARRPELVSVWVGLGHAHAGDPAAFAVGAMLLADRLRGAGLRGARAEHWWAPGMQGLVLFAGGPMTARVRSRDVTVLRERLQRVVEETARDMGPAEVRSAGDRLERDIRLLARTPQGLAAAIGELTDRTGEPGALGQYLSSLKAVEPDAVIAVLRGLRNDRTAIVEVTP